MLYNYYFEIAAIFIICVILYDYENKMRVFRADAILFKGVLYVSLLESCVNLLSCMLLKFADRVPLALNIAVVSLFFVVQALKIYMVAAFSFVYMNPHFSKRDPWFYILAGLCAVNAILGVTSPWTKFYFYFDEERRYVQGYGSDWGFYFYFINIAACLIYVLLQRRRILKKDILVAGWTAVIIGLGVLVQFFNRSTLTVGFGVTAAMLYLYMTLENPNDYQDKLTLGGNAYGFKIQIDYKAAQKKIFSVCFIDIQKFRYVNSIYGTEMGDYLLREIALFLEKTFIGNVVFRVHNDLFAVIMDEPQVVLESYVVKIQKRFHHSWKLPNEKRMKIKPFVAVCEYPEYFQSHTELTKLQKTMMKIMKESHDTSALFCDDIMAENYRRHEIVERALERAMENHTLETYYQPIMDQQAGHIVALEALSRLNDPKLGVISPAEFIPIAETSGQIIRLGFYVMRQVCTFIEEKLLTDPNNLITCIHVNLSMLQCAYDGLKNSFQEIIEKYNVPTSMIQLELTESTMLESPDMVQKTMKELVDYGLLFALDDYGTGYSNISYLIQFPFEKIKFDKNMVWSYFKQENARKIMQNEFHLLKSLGKEIVVEGIETKEQYEEMEKQGIRFFQGYYFSPALPETKCIEYLKEYNSGKNHFD